MGGISILYWAVQIGLEEKVPFEQRKKVMEECTGQLTGQEHCEWWEEGSERAGQ